MFTRNAMALVVLGLCCAIQAPAEEIIGLPLHIDRIDDAVVRLWIGDHESTTAVTALATADGVVVIDTTAIPAVDVELRRVIARELGRDDFRYLINTHEHSDHIAGNSVYADCQIIAHELAVEGIARAVDGSARVIEWHRESLPELEAEAAAAESDEMGAKLGEKAAVARAKLAAHERGIEWTLPTLTFSDRMRLDMGDTTFELYSAGGLHSASDIFVFVPEHGLLFTGDTMADVWLTDSPGCLTSFDIRSDVRHDFPVLLANWGSLVARRDEIRDLIPGHWNGDLTYQGFVNRYTYVKALWEGISEAAAAGWDLDQVRAAYSLEQRFPELVDSPGITPQWHAVSIMSLWQEITGTESAARRLHQRLDEVGVEEAIEECRAARAAGSPGLYFSEAELNQVGYLLLGENKVDQAIAVFELNTMLFPASWNVYDSLAEAHMLRGDDARAIELYRRSLELNPDNGNGLAMIERIRDGSAD